MKPGRYAGLSNHDYHRSDGISKSALALLRKTPAHYAAKYIYGAWEPPTKPMMIGSAFHTLALEPHLFDVEFAVAPAVDRRTKAGKAEHQLFIDNSGNRAVIDLADYELIQNMEMALRRHTGASYLLDQMGIAEESFYWTDEATGLLCKCRPDWHIPERQILVDLKTCEDASPEGFARTIYNYSYYLQSGYYLDGVSQVLGQQYRTFIFVAVEKSPPHAVAVYQLDQDDIDKGKREAADLLRLFKWCSDRNEWPGYGDEIQTIMMPKWAQAKEIAIYE